jgi:hypothetical protein
MSFSGGSYTKAQKREASKKAAAKRRVAVALAKYLKQANPGTKLAGAKVEKLKGGVLKITPIKANPKSLAELEAEGRRHLGFAAPKKSRRASGAGARQSGPYYVWTGNVRQGPIETMKEAKAIAAWARKQGHRGASVSRS